MEPTDHAARGPTARHRSIAEQELINSLGWLIRMRWFAAGAVLLAAAVTEHVVGIHIPERDGYLVGFAIFGYNVLFRLALARLVSREPQRTTAYEWFARVQMGFDWLAMGAIIAFSGGVESPAIIFFLFHIAIASLLLPHDKAFLYVTLAPVIVGAIAAAEARGWLAHVSLVEPARYRDGLYVAEVLVFFTCASYVMAYLAMAISSRLRRRENEVSEAYERLADVDRQKSNFIRTVTHELRSPVQVAQNLLTVLEQGYVGDLSAEQADLVTRARRRLEFLQLLVDDLLQLAAGRAGARPRGEPKPIFLADVVARVCDRFAAAARAKGLEIHSEVTDEPLVVLGEASELDCLLNNLLSNAVKYTPSGRVSVELAAEADTARVVVRDTGIGIPERALPRLFEEFFRATNAKAIENHGTGLGLAIVHDLVERYGGTVSVESVEGEGTAFTVRLPVVTAINPS